MNYATGDIDGAGSRGIDATAGPARLVREPPEPYDKGDGSDAPEAETPGAPEAPRASDASGEASLDPEPLSPDELDDLADEITTLSAHIHAARARLGRLVARFDEFGG